MTSRSFDPFQTSQTNGIRSSMWAPKQQQRDELTENPWRGDAGPRPQGHGAHQPLAGLGISSFPPGLFLQQDALGMDTPTRYNHIGAIGDGRKRGSTSDVPDRHVEQLFRYMNLNSPPPLNSPPTHRPPFTINTDISPDVSPMSQASALLTPIDSPTRTPTDMKAMYAQDFDYGISPVNTLFGGAPGTPPRVHDILPPSPHNVFFRHSPPQTSYSVAPSSNGSPFEPFVEETSRQPFGNMSPSGQHVDSSVRGSEMSWRPQAGWLKPSENLLAGFGPSSDMNGSPPSRAPFEADYRSRTQSSSSNPANDPINFLTLLHPSSSPPYHVFVARIIKSSDQQASIFLQQKLKVADLEERTKIVDAICSRGYEMMAHRFGNWAVQRCLEAATTPDERRKIAACMRGRVVELSTNCYGCHVLQKALDCEEDIRFLIVSELLLGDPAQTLINKHASHVWSKIMELTWSSPAPPIFAYVNKALQGQWASLACHETGSLVVQHAFENLEESAKDNIVDELLNRGPSVFSEVARNQWGSYCIQHILEHGSPKHRAMTLDLLISGLLEYATNEQGAKSVNKALKDGGKEGLDRIVTRMAEPAKGARRAMIVDLALSVTGSQLIANVLPSVDKDQRALLYESIRGHIVTLRGCKTGSKVIWLFDRMRAYYGY